MLFVVQSTLIFVEVSKGFGMAVGDVSSGDLIAWQKVRSCLLLPFEVHPDHCLVLTKLDRTPMLATSSISSSF